MEDKFLKSNVPGKWSQQDAGGTREVDLDRYERKQLMSMSLQNDDDAMFDMAKQMAYDDVPEPVKLKILNDRMKGNQTGVKGVLADYRADCAMKDAQVTARKEHREAVLNRMARGSVVSSGNQEMLQEAPTSIFKFDNEEDEDDDDDEFMREYRQKRLQELKQGVVPHLQTTGLAQLGMAFGGSHYGSVMEIGAEDYTREVSADTFTPAQDYVIVHMYEPSIPACKRLNDCLDSIARDQPGVKFLRIDVDEHNIGIDRATLPILTVYQGGEVVDITAGISQPEELGETFNKLDVAWMLSGYFPAVNGV